MLLILKKRKRKKKKTRDVADMHNAFLATALFYSPYSISVVPGISVTNLQNER